MLPGFPEIPLTLYPRLASRGRMILTVIPAGYYNFGVEL
jgi:hypothetical protein